MGYRFYMGIDPETEIIVGKPSEDYKDREFIKILEDHEFTKEGNNAIFNKYANTEIEWLAEYIYELMNGYLTMCDLLNRRCTIPDFSHLPKRRPDIVYISWG